MKHKKTRHFFHLVDASPWPFRTAVALFLFLSQLVLWFHYQPIVEEDVERAFIEYVGVSMELENCARAEFWLTTGYDYKLVQPIYYYIGFNRAGFVKGANIMLFFEMGLDKRMTADMPLWLMLLRLFYFMVVYGLVMQIHFLMFIVYYDMLTFVYNFWYFFLTISLYPELHVQRCFLSFELAYLFAVYLTPADLFLTATGLSFLLLILILIGWWRDVVRESTFEGKHTSYVQTGLRIGMILFIITEVMFFFSFFWGFFHSSLSPSAELGSVWPPSAIKVLPAFGVPLLNTEILLLSGAAVTYAHHALCAGEMSKFNRALLLTILLAILFTGLQIFEYIEAPFTIADSVYGSTFFLLTGFHGIHVIVGTIFLSVQLIRSLRGQLTPTHHLGFEFAVWYWHFVDFVWLLLFASIYWWGGMEAVADFTFREETTTVETLPTVVELKNIFPNTTQHKMINPFDLQWIIKGPNGKIMRGETILQLSVQKSPVETITTKAQIPPLSNNKEN